MKKQTLNHPNKEDIIELIVKGNLDSAINESFKLIHQNHDAYKYMVLISFRYYILWKETLTGVAVDKERTINKIASDLIDILDSLDSDSS